MWHLLPQLEHMWELVAEASSAAGVSDIGIIIDCGMGKEAKAEGDGEGGEERKEI